MLTNYETQAFGRAPRIKDRWEDEVGIVAGSGPSLTAEVVEQVAQARDLIGARVIAVNDAYRLLPFADALYACDWEWWRTHDFVPGFRGAKFTCTSHDPTLIDDKSQLGAGRYGITLVEARNGKGFGVDCIHYGSQGSSGFQATNLALLFGCLRVVLVGFDMRHVDGRSHYFGDHPPGLRTCPDRGYRDLANSFPPDSRIRNATPGSAIKAYPFVDLGTALANCVHRDRTQPDAAAD